MSSEEVKEVLEEQTNSEENDKKSLEIAIAQFFGACDSIGKYDISTKGFKRALLYSLNKGLTTRGDKIKLRNDDEKKVAMIIGIALDSRLIMMAHAIKNNKKEEGEEQDERSTDS